MAARGLEALTLPTGDASQQKGKTVGEPKAATPGWSPRSPTSWPRSSSAHATEEENVAAEFKVAKATITNWVKVLLKGGLDALS